MASLGLLSSVLGFSETQNAMMIALYISMDSFGTACNVTGDGALSAILNSFFDKKIDRLKLFVKKSVISIRTNNLFNNCNEQYSKSRERKQGLYQSPGFG